MSVTLNGRDISVTGDNQYIEVTFSVICSDMDSYDEVTRRVEDLILEMQHTPDVPLSPVVDKSMEDWFDALGYTASPPSNSIPFPDAFPDGAVITLTLTGPMKAGQFIYEPFSLGDIDVGVLLEDTVFTKKYDDDRGEYYFVHTARVRVEKGSNTYKNNRHFVEKFEKPKEEEPEYKCETTLDVEL